MEIARHNESVMFRAWQPSFNRHVAVHLLPGRTVDGLEADARRTAPLADHPNVVTVHELGVTDAGVPYLVTELLERKATQDWYEASRVTITVAGVLDAARRAGVGDLAVTPDDVSFSRFGEPQVSLFGRQPVATEPEGVRSLLRGFLPAGADCPVSVREALAGPVDDDADLVRLLQRAQREAGRPVTELPVEPSTGPAPTGPDSEGLSAALTVAPPLASVRRLRRGASIGAAVLLVVGVLAVVMTAGPERERAASTATTAPSLPMTSVVGNGPPDQRLHVANFTSGSWAPSERYDVRNSLVDGRLRIQGRARGGRTFPVWRPPADESRLSIAVDAHIPPDQMAEIGIICGQPGPGSRFLMATLRSDGSWQIEISERVVAEGSAPERQQELRDPFVIRLDCVTSTSPTRAALFLNDRLVAESDGGGAFPFDGVSILAGTKGYEPFEVFVSGIAVRRLD